MRQQPRPRPPIEPMEPPQAGCFWTAVIIAIGCLLFWMAVGVAGAWLAGRL